MRPFLAEDPGEYVVGTAHAVGRVFGILHCQGDGCCEQPHGGTELASAPSSRRFSYSGSCQTRNARWRSPG